MNNSILQFSETGIPNLEKLVENFMKNPKDTATFINESKEEFMNFLINFIGETFTDCDRCLRESPRRKKDWEIVKRDRKSLITSIGEVQFEKTLFKNKKSGGREYLLDRIMGIEQGERITEDAAERLYNEAAQTSYRRAGEELSLTSSVSKQTVKNKLHGLKFPPMNPPAAKKAVDYLYIDADEDHVALQFKDKKGDLTASPNGYKYNSVLAKLVYVYEGVEPEAPRSRRHRLVNPHYFSGVYAGKDNEKLWDEVYEYLDSHYDLSKVKTIYLNSDGGTWIKAVNKRFGGIAKVLDGFHLSQYLLKMTKHMGGSFWDANNELRSVIKNGNKGDFINLSSILLGYAETVPERKRIIDGRDYILNNWSPAKARLHSRDKICGCSAEGHVSHVLSGRMSSRPMGWSVTGVDRMAHLRAYYWNKGNMLELARYQKKVLPLAAGCEEAVLSSKNILASERAKGGTEEQELRKYSDCMRVSLNLQTKKQIWFNSQIWGL
jgi:hypothetical protein